MHYGLGVGWGPLYGLLRRYGAMEPVGAGIVAGVSMWAIVDEALNPVLGFTAPSRAYPTTTHLRGFINHLVFGLVLTGAAEAMYRATDMTPRPE